MGVFFDIWPLLASMKKKIKNGDYLIDIQFLDFVCVSANFEGNRKLRIIVKFIKNAAIVSHRVKNKCTQKLTIAFTLTF